MSATAVCIDGVVTLLRKPRRCKQLKGRDSAWIDRHGNFYSVPCEGHSDWSYKYFGGDYEQLESSGWIHLSFSSVYYYPGTAKRTLSRQQVDTLERWFDHNGDEHGLARLMKARKSYFVEEG
jgi:hypothetical protein